MFIDPVPEVENIIADPTEQLSELYESSVKGEEECVIAYALLLVLNNE
jgi:hypothetical protein